MKKVSVALIVGIVLSVIGVIMMAATAVFAYNEYKNYNKFTEDTLTLSGDVDYKFEFSAGTVNFHTTTEDSYITYKIVNLYEITCDDEKVVLKNKNKFLFGFLGNKNVLDVYLNEEIADNYVEIKLNAGKINVEDELSFAKLDIKLNAGTITINKLAVAGELDIKLNAGELHLKDVSADKITTSINAGTANLDAEFNSINFTVNAGSFNLTAAGSKSDYTIKVSKSAGSSNAENGGSGAKKIEGHINAGSFKLSYKG